MANKFLRLKQLFYTLASAVLIFYGSLALFAGISGPEPVVLGWFSHFRLSLTSLPVYSIVFGCASIGLGALLLIKLVCGRRVS